MRIKGSFFLDCNVKLSLALSTNVRQRATFQTFSLSWMTNKCAWSETAAVSVYLLTDNSCNQINRARII